jgi:ribonucleoside-triphosphate reductase
MGGNGNGNGSNGGVGLIEGTGKQSGLEQILGIEEETRLRIEQISQEVAENEYYVMKRDGRKVLFDITRPGEAIFKAATAKGGKNKDVAYKNAIGVYEYLKSNSFIKGKIPDIEIIQDTVIDTLMSNGHEKTAKAYATYRDLRAMVHGRMRVSKTLEGQSDSTDDSLRIGSETKYQYLPWNKQLIVDALKNEAKVPDEIAYDIARNTEKIVLDLYHGGIKRFTTADVRQFVDMQLRARGLEGTLKAQKSLGMPKADVKKLFVDKSQENSNISANNPEAINLGIAESIIKQYMLEDIFV